MKSESDPLSSEFEFSSNESFLTEESCCLSPSLDDLPDELLMKILSYIHPISKTFAQLRGTSKRLYDVLQTSSLYKTSSIDLSGNRPFDFDTLLSTTSRSAKYLTELNLSHSDDVTDYVIFQLAKVCNGLRALDLSYCQLLTNCGLRVLANIVRLFKVDISGCPNITSRGVYLFVKLSGDSLEELSMNSCMGLRNDPHRLPDMSIHGCKLKRLEMDWEKRLVAINPLRSVDLDRLTEHLRTLQYLDISQSRCGDADIEAIVMNCSLLLTLKLRNCSLHDRGLKHIGRWLPILQHLDIADNHDITDRGLEFIACGCDQYLEHVDVSRCFDIHGPGLNILASACHSLHTVIARECFDMTSNTITYISLHCTNVRHLDVSFNLCVTDGTLSSIAHDRRRPDEELEVVTEGCPHVLGHRFRGSVESCDRRRFRFVDWEAKGNDEFVIWETNV
nr:F-box/LRR-repeat protein 2-like [Lytechinus pictus]